MAGHFLLLATVARQVDEAPGRFTGLLLDVLGINLGEPAPDTPFLDLDEALCLASLQVGPVDDFLERIIEPGVPALGQSLGNLPDAIQRWPGDQAEEEGHASWGACEAVG